jgi:hypothetical protein
VAHLTRGIAALKILPETPDIAQLQLALQLALGPALMTTKGFGAQQAKSTYQRACYLAEQLGDDRRRFAALWGLWLSEQAITSGKEPEALSDELYRVAAQIGDSGLRLQAHHSAWATLLWSGRLLESCEHVRQGLSLYDRDKHRSHALTLAVTIPESAYKAENKKIMEAVARHIIGIATGTDTDKVVPMRGRNTRGNHAAR